MERKPGDVSRAGPERARTWVPLPAGHVARDRITSAVLSSTARVFFLIAGPGYGKSITLHELARVADSPVVLVDSLRGRTDRRQFWATITESIGSAVEGSFDALLAGLRDGEEPDPDFVDALLDELEHVRPVSGSIILAVDDYHLIEDRAVHDLVELLVERLHDRIRLVLSTRVDPTLPVARWELRSWAQVLRHDALVFDRHETATVLRSAAGFDISPTTLDLVHERTEGWPAGVRVAALALTTAQGEASVVEALTGSNRTVADFFADEVLRVLPAADREFVLETSILDVLTPALCRAVTGHNGAGHVLEDLERRGIFTTRVDPAGTQFRYHHLFADTLRRQFSSGDHEGYRSAHRRAANELSQQRHYVEAVDHLIEASEHERALRLILDRHREIVEALPSGGLARIVDRLPAHVFGERAGIIDLALLTATSARLLDAEVLLQSLDLSQDGADWPPRGFWLDVVIAAALGNTTRLRMAWAHRSEVTMPDPILAAYWREIPIAFVIDDDHDAAAEAWQTAIDHGFDTLAPPSVHHGALAFDAAWSGRMIEALPLIDEGMASIDERGEALQVGNSRLFVAAALAAMEDDRLEDAEELIDEGMALASLIDATSSFTIVLEATLIELLRRTGVPDVGLRRADNALRRGEGRTGLSPLFRSVVSEAALRCALDAGDLARAEELTRELADGVPKRLGTARLQLAQRDPASARRELATLDLRRLERRAPRRALEALLLAERVQPSRRSAVSEPALRLADRHGLHGSLRSWSLGPDDRSGRAAPDHALARDRTDATIRALEVAPLTDREIEVLSLLPTQMSNAELAEELMVSVHTVKSHIKAVYRKLQASGRSDAVRVARGVGLLPPRAESVPSSSSRPT